MSKSKPTKIWTLEPRPPKRLAQNQTLAINITKCVKHTFPGYPLLVLAVAVYRERIYSFHCTFHAAMDSEGGTRYQPLYPKKSKPKDLKKIACRALVLRENLKPKENPSSPYYTDSLGDPLEQIN